MSLRQYLVRRLEAMNRRALRGYAPDGATLLRPSPTLGSFSGETDVLPGGREWIGERGCCLVLTEDLRETWKGTTRILERLRPALVTPPGEGVRGWPKSWVHPWVSAIDLETCGFASTPIFMIGIIETDGVRMSIHQGLARDYGEEAALLEWAAGRLGRSGGIVTFNGRSFDMPYLRERRAYHRFGPLVELPHLDLLHLARRLWGAHLPDCRLQTLERHLIGRERRGDIPGREIPDVYHTFVDTGDVRLMRIVAQHNRLDLITLMELFGAAWHEARLRTDLHCVDNDVLTERQ